MSFSVPYLRAMRKAAQENPDHFAQDTHFSRT
jgi:hypothetical protein